MSDTLRDSKVDQLTTQVIDQKGRQIKNLGNASSPQDAVTFHQLQDAIDSVTGSNSSLDSYLQGSTIYHKLVHVFQKAVKFLGAVTVSGLTTLANVIQAGTITLSSLTASRPLKLDGSKNIISSKIDLSASSTDVQNTLGVPNGGTGQSSFTVDSVLLGNGTSGFTEEAGVTNSIALSSSAGNQSVTLSAQGFTSVTLQYKDWAGANQSQVVITGVTLAIFGLSGITLQSPVVISVSLQANAFTKGVKTT